MNTWYYVENNDRVGPVEQSEMENLVRSGRLGASSFVWRKGLENWIRLEEATELSHVLEINQSPEVIDIPPIETVRWDSISNEDRIFTIKTGLDRGGSDSEYGPFSIEILKKLFNENRINAKTLIYTAGLENWKFLADTPIYKRVTNSLPPVISDSEKRSNVRKPFVARMLFHDNERVYDGVCRDISIGGLQVLISDFPGEAGDKVSMNVHPDNSEYSFVASGTIVRKLEGNTGFSIRFVNLSKEALEAIKSFIEGQ